MYKADVLTLIGETPEAHGVFDEFEPAERDVFCTVRSVGFSEFYTAKAAGLAPDVVFVLAHDFEYQGEKKARFHDVDYEIIRTYATEPDGIELTAQRKEGNRVAE